VLKHDGDPGLRDAKPGTQCGVCCDDPQHDPANPEPL